MRDLYCKILSGRASLRGTTKGDKNLNELFFLVSFRESAWKDPWSRRCSWWSWPWSAELRTRLPRQGRHRNPIPSFTVPPVLASVSVLGVDWKGAAGACGVTPTATTDGLEGAGMAAGAQDAEQSLNKIVKVWSKRLWKHHSLKTINRCHWNTVDDLNFFAHGSWANVLQVAKVTSSCAIGFLDNMAAPFWRERQIYSKMVWKTKNQKGLWFGTEPIFRTRRPSTSLELLWATITECRGPCLLWNKKPVVQGLVLYNICKTTVRPFYDLAARVS